MLVNPVAFIGVPSAVKRSAQGWRTSNDVVVTRESPINTHIQPGLPEP